MLKDAVERDRQPVGAAQIDDALIATAHHRAAARAPSVSAPTATRVCSIPSVEHPYVARVTGLPDRIDAVDPGPSIASDGSWRPSPVFEPGWAREHAGEVDVVHLHFGYEHLSAPQLAAWVDELHRYDIGLVFTAHDLTNPHLVDQAPHHANLGVLCTLADVVITLTEGAAAQIREQFGRTATVLAHPHQFDARWLGRRAQPRSTGGVQVLGLSLRALRPSMDAEAALNLLHPVRALSGDRVRTRILADSCKLAHSHPEVALTLAEGAADGSWDIVDVDGRLAENELWDFVSSLNALLLPYRWGSHSGWIESCRDVGTSVLAPASGPGFWAEQGASAAFDLDGSAASLLQILDSLAVEPPLDPACRIAQQREIATRHGQIYAAVARRHAGQLSAD